jgi:nucleoid-associated protein YgaU
MTTPIAGIHLWDEHDTWWEISARYTGSGLNWIHLVDANPQIRNPNKVPVGSRVNIPVDLTR